MIRNNDKVYGSLAKFFHWTIGFSMLFMVIFGYLMSGVRLLSFHQQIGLIILILVIFRFIWMLINKQPKLTPQMRVFEKLLAKLVQGLLYVCMFGMPLSGWAMSTAFGFAPHVGGFAFPMPGIEVDQSFGVVMLNIHFILSVGLIVCVGLHVIGALKHHFVEKNNVLRSMLPNYFTKNID